MNRFVYSRLLEWKKRGSGRVLIVSGVSGVGKSSLVKRFVTRDFENPGIYSNVCLGELSEKTFKNSANDIFVFDDLGSDIVKLKKIIELQDLFPDKFFIVIDTYIKSKKDSNISADYLPIYPLSFEEFLFNCHIEYFNSLRELRSLDDIDDKLHLKLNELLFRYLILGGFPAVISDYIDNGLNFNSAREIQNRIIDRIFESLSNNFSWVEAKNAKAIIKLIFTSLTRENKKFKFSDISSSRRYRSLKEYFLIVFENNIAVESFVVKDCLAIEDEKSFILYFCDTGLLGALGHVPETLYNNEFMYKNPITLGLIQNLIACEGKSVGLNSSFSWFHNISRIEIIFKKDDKVIPVEVKNYFSGKLKSFESFRKIMNISNNYRVTMEKYQKGSVTTLPIYIIGSFLRNYFNC